MALPAERGSWIMQRVAEVMGARMQRACMLLEAGMKKTLSGPRRGRRYRVPGTRRWYTASAPGEPPAVRFGLLRSRVRSGVAVRPGSGAVRIVGYVVARTLYAQYLERGTSRMAARPYWAPTWEREKGRVKAILKEPWP